MAECGSQCPDIALDIADCRFFLMRRRKPGNAFQIPQSKWFERDDVSCCRRQKDPFEVAQHGDDYLEEYH